MRTSKKKTSLAISALASGLKNVELVKYQPYSYCSGCSLKILRGPRHVTPWDLRYRCLL